MAPIPITEDFYMILQVEQNATTQVIASAYRRLALQLHPDRNNKPDATGAFQLLGRAYETLKDEQKRRSYDLLYPSLKGDNASPPASAPKPQLPVETAQIVVIQRAKQDRSARWQADRKVLESSKFEIERVIRRLEQSIKLLSDIATAEATAEAQNNSWTAWFSPSSYGRKNESEEEKALKDRNKQERRLEQDMKERRLQSYQTDLKKAEGQLETAKRDFDSANLADDCKIAALQSRKWQRENLERQRREETEQEKKEALLREQRQREQAAAEAIRKAMAEMRAAHQKHQEEEEEEEARKRQNASRHRHYTRPETAFEMRQGLDLPAAVSKLRNHGMSKVSGLATTEENAQLEIRSGKSLEPGF